MHIVVCNEGPSGLIFALLLSEIFVTKNISGKITIFHTHNSKNELFLVNKNDFLRLPRNIFDYISSAAVFKEIFSAERSAYFMDELENKLLEIILKSNNNFVQVIKKRFYPTSTQYDLLVLADGYSVNLQDNYRFEKEVILKSYELKVNFQTTKNQLQNNETEILSLLQTRYFLEQDNDQNFLKVNLSKSEYDNIDFNDDSTLNSIKNPWFLNIIRDGFEFFEVNVDEKLISITKSSNDLLVSKEFYKSYQQLDVCTLELLYQQQRS
ncbi:hypothetical protein RhiirC2_327960 [Rhizophagus irregularis]|uniref:Uncharacterized protein n=1 Tax=Rhizophagus irregularis TaxID=588596 RepID=A0A2N1NIL6_9GLOM|nr:hypothetical protein RhiirC2_327960 [Rhizophagus irregularis]